MGAGATFTYNGHPENGFLQLVGSHEIDTSGGGDFKIDYANLRIVNDAASESLNTHAVFNVHDSILSGQGKIVTDSFSFDNSKFSPDSAVLWTDLSAGHLTRTQFDALTAADAERIGELQIDAAASGITIIADAHYYVDLDPANSRNDKITITGAVNGTPTMNIDAFFGSAPTSMTPITILSASGGHNISVGTFTDNTPAVLQAAHMQAKVTTDANNIYIAFDPVTADLIWKGQPNMTWENNSSRVNWFVDDGTNQADSFFLDGDSVTFKSGAAGSTEGIVTVDAAGVNPARIYMDNGGTYTFTGGDINVTGDFQIQNAYVTINNKVTAAHVNADSQTLTLDNADITAEVNYNGYNKLLVVNPSKITGNLNINSGTLSIVVPDYASATASASTPMLDVISGNIILGSPYYKLIELDTTALTAPGFSVGDKIVVARAASSITKPDDISYDALPAGGDFREKQMKLAAEVAGNELYLAVKAFGPITWKNVTGKGQTGNMTWEAVGDPIWEDEDGKETEFYTNDDVIFAGAGQGDITVKDPVYPNSVQIKNGAYSFSGASVNVMNDTAVNNATVSFTSDLTTNQLDIQNKSDVTLKNETTAAQITVRASTLTLDGAKITLNGIGASQGYLDVGGQSKLNIYNYPDITGDLKISGEMTYYVPDGFKVADGIALMTVSRDSNITDSTIDVRIPGTGEPLHPSDEIILLGSNTITGTPKNIIVANDTIKVEFGTTLAYSLFELSVENNKLIARLAADLSKDFALAAALEKDKVLSEAYLGGIAALNAGGDLIGESGIRSLVDGFKTLANRFDYHGFAVTQGGYTRYDTGSHVDLKSFSVAAGLSKGVALKKSEFVWGAFFEYGNGSYDTFNSFAGAGYVHGKGNIRYFGGGLLGRLDFSGDKASSYFEGSIRAGRVRNHYDGSAASDVASYDASATYAGFHVGAGTVLSLSEKAKLDLSAKYFLTRTGSETVTLSSGEEVAFDAAKSSRLRLGARLSPNKSARFRPYAAAYYEYEFDGAAKAEIVAAGLPIASPSLKGATGIGEVGVVFQPSAFIPFTVDVALQGYTGKRKGVTGTLHFQYRF
ncbi:MAG: autotransporter outer membrane beta-barrel domain-containing protein [Fusobacteriaceae bacterium]|nr:autotransporter outer membrane beta-barrel domain-containing protein [Fusobacteriaceae bacterium]